MTKKQILEKIKEKEEQSLIDAILQDILKKEGRPVEHQDIAEEGLDDPRFKVSIRTKYQVGIWRGAKAKGRIYQRIAEKIGWKELGKLVCQGTLDHFREFAETKLKPIIKMLNKINKNDYSSFVDNYLLLQLIFNFLFSHFGNTAKMVKYVRTKHMALVVQGLNVGDLLELICN